MEYKNNLSDLKTMLGQKRKSPNIVEDISKNPSENVIMEPDLEGEKVSKIKKKNNLLPKNKDNNINNKQNEDGVIVQDIDININEDKEDKSEKKKSEEGTETNNNLTVSPKKGKANTNEKKKAEKVIIFIYNFRIT